MTHLTTLIFLQLMVGCRLGSSLQSFSFLTLMFCHSVLLCVGRSLQPQDCVLALYRLHVVALFLHQGLETRIIDYSTVICSAIWRRKLYKSSNSLDEAWQWDIATTTESDLLFTVLWLRNGNLNPQLRLPSEAKWLIQVRWPLIKYLVILNLYCLEGSGRYVTHSLIWSFSSIRRTVAVFRMCNTLSTVEWINFTQILL